MWRCIRGLPEISISKTSLCGEVLDYYKIELETGLTLNLPRAHNIEPILCLRADQLQHIESQHLTPNEYLVSSRKNVLGTQISALGKLIGMVKAGGDYFPDKNLLMLRFPTSINLELTTFVKSFFRTKGIKTEHRMGDRAVVLFSEQLRDVDIDQPWTWEFIQHHGLGALKGILSMVHESVLYRGSLKLTFNKVGTRELVQKLLLYAGTSCRGEGASLFVENKEGVNLVLKLLGQKGRLLRYTSKHLVPPITRIGGELVFPTEAWLRKAGTSPEYFNYWYHKIRSIECLRGPAVVVSTEEDHIDGIWLS